MGIEAKKAGKILGEPPVRILTDISLKISEGDYVSLTGRSGSGKSSLLYLLSTLDSATEGTVEIDGQDTGRMTGRELSRFRNERAGFVFQFHYLIGELTALENVLLPAQKSGQSGKKRAYAQQLLEQVGLAGKFGRFPRHLSGGEQQRVAIARALVMQPRYLFADEPTGSLDTENSEIVLKIMEDANRKNGTTVLLVTHDPDFAARAPRQIHIADGKIISQS